MFAFVCVVLPCVSRGHAPHARSPAKHHLTEGLKSWKFFSRLRVLGAVSALKKKKKKKKA
jgi:hypothetical protein